MRAPRDGDYEAGALAPPFYFFLSHLTWGELADLWVACTLHPTTNTLRIAELIRRGFAVHLYHDLHHELTLGDIMGMYDRKPNFEDDFGRGDRFVLMGLEYVGTISTVKGPAEKVLVHLVTRESYPNTLTYSALGVGLAELARNATPDDFPHVAEFVRVRRASGNEVKLFAKVDVSPTDWRQGNNGPPLTIEQADVDAPATPTSNVDPGF